MSHTHHLHSTEGEMLQACDGIVPLSLMISLIQYLSLHLRSLNALMLSLQLSTLKKQL